MCVCVCVCYSLSRVLCNPMDYSPPDSSVHGILQARTRVDCHTLLQTSVQFSPVTQSCSTLCDPMDHSSPGFLVHHQLPEFTQTHVHRVGEAIQPFLILCLPLLLLPSIFPSIRVFSNESVLHIRWPKYLSFSFSISPSNEYSGLISFRMD